MDGSEKNQEDMDKMMDDNHTHSQPSNLPINPSVADSTREPKEGIILQSLSNEKALQQNVDVETTVDMLANNHPKEPIIIDKEENTPSKEQQNAQTSTAIGGDGGNSNSVDEFSSRDEQNMDLEMTFESRRIIQTNQQIMR